MGRYIDDMCGFLLSCASASIRLRVKSEVIGSIAEEEAEKLRAEIRGEPIYRLIAACQKENGWLGNGFHGPNRDAGPYENQEVGTKYLAEKGVGRDDEVLKGAMDAFVTVPLDDLCYRTKGKYFDEFRYAANGQNLIRCACIARAGFDDVIDISPQIGLSLESFKRVTEVDSILDVSRTIQKGRYRVFNDRERWPSRYHFDILAHTDSWKNAENIRMLADSFNRLMRRDRPELIGVGADSWVGYKLGTLGCLSEGFSLTREIGGVKAVNLEYVEWMCRCGLYGLVPELTDTVDRLAETIDADGICRADVDYEQLKGISTYGGQQLEADHKTDIRRLCDVTFRALLIMKYSCTI